MSHNVSKEQMSALPYIIACDFDGTLVEDKFPEIGAANDPIFELLCRARENGAKIILWTCRDGEALKQAIEFCEDHSQLKFDAVNDNLPECIALFGGGNTRKVYANEYWDDKAVVIGYEPDILAENDQNEDDWL